MMRNVIAVTEKVIGSSREGLQVDGPPSPGYAVPNKPRKNLRRRIGEDACVVVNDDKTVPLVSACAGAGWTWALR